jgi:hypothetical protein
VQSMIATGPRRGCKVMRLGNDPHGWRGELVLGRRCAMVEGFNVHANTAIKADDREGREHLLRYIARPPLSDERLSQLEDGRVAVRLKKAWRDGTTHVAFTPEEFMEKLVALVPRPRANLVRYHGVFAPAAGDRRRIVPKGASIEARAKDGDADGCCRGAHPSLRKQRWAELMKRVFKVDVLECPRCQNRMTIVATVLKTDAIVKILSHLGLETTAPMIHPARPPPTQEVLWDSDPGDWAA